MILETFLAHPAVQALGRALLHFLWQGSLLAFLLWLVRTIAPVSAARTRYAAASLIMFLMPVALVLTATRDLRNGERATLAPVARSAARIAAAAPQAAVLYAPIASQPRVGLSGWAVCIWITGVLLLSFRAAGGWMRVQQLNRGALPATAELEDLLRRLRLRLSISAPVRLWMSAVVQVPTAIGWIRPYVLLPVTTCTGLSESQIAAILAHELAHIRRHDYLVNLLQTGIETVLFYHPAVWWVGKQMRIEREHCCDDVAVEACGNPIEYAGALAELEEIRCRIPEPALAATGGELPGRIRRLLADQAGQQDHTSRSVGTMAAAASVLLVAAGVSVYAAPQGEPAFDVASIKPYVGDDPGHRYRMGPQFTVEKATLKDLVELAYDIKDFQVSGGPGWINSDRYDIETKAAVTPAPGPEGPILQRRRLQSLLQDRFQLKVHRETRELPIYELIMTKGGARLETPNCIQRQPYDTTTAPGKTLRDYCGYGGFGRGTYEATSQSVADFAYALAFVLDRTVVDKTGITGTFRFHLAFVPDQSLHQFPGDPPPAAADDGPSIFTAIQEQLGLKLESARGPVEVLVIDHVEKPSAN